MIEAPRSGSVEQNGHMVAEQIGGQIFIDTWGLVAPGNPDLAAKYAEQAASVTHGGNGIYGGIFIAACIAYAFEETDIKKIIEKGLSYIPADCEYTRVVRAVMTYYDEHPESWRDCFRYVFENFGYDKYPGNCHIIPNIAVMILSLLYGGGDFDDTLGICNMCGWDTDGNVGNVATIMGVICGAEAIGYEKWRKPVNDFLACSSVVGSLNIMDIPYGASYIAKLAWAVAGEELPAPWKEIIDNRIDGCHFEYSGSTHAMRARVANAMAKTPEITIMNTDEAAHSGKRSLKAHVMPLRPGERVYLYKKTHYRPADFHDSRYDPCFSPLVYPGQAIHGAAFLPDYGRDCIVRLYAHDSVSDRVFEGEAVTMEKGKWAELSMTIPPLADAIIDEAGFAFDMLGIQSEPVELTAMVDDLYFDGRPDYSIDFAKSEEEVWTGLHREIIQFTKLKGLFYLEGARLHLSCGDFAEAYTGRHDWRDYTAAFTLTPLTGEDHFVNVRVQGAIRSYAAGLTAGGKLALMKNENGYRTLCEADFPWQAGKEYTITVEAKGAALAVSVDGRELLRHTDSDSPYLTGSVGISVKNGSHCSYSGIKVN